MNKADLIEKQQPIIIDIHTHFIKEGMELMANQMLEILTDLKEMEEDKDAFYAGWDFMGDMVEMGADGGKESAYKYWKERNEPTN